MVSTYAGRLLAIDQALYESERATAHRNRAIGHMLRNFNIISEDPEPALDLYFRQCSIAVTRRDLTRTGSWLRNDEVPAIVAVSFCLRGSPFASVVGRRIRLLAQTSTTSRDVFPGCRG
jgi:glutaminase